MRDGNFREGIRLRENLLDMALVKSFERSKGVSPIDVRGENLCAWITCGIVRLDGVSLGPRAEKRDETRDEVGEGVGLAPPSPSLPEQTTRKGPPRSSETPK